MASLNASKRTGSGRCFCADRTCSPAVSTRIVRYCTTIPSSTYCWSTATEARWVCARVPITGAGVTYWNQKRWSLGARMSWQRGLRFSRGSVLLAGVSVARWWGPVRIGVEGIVGGSSDGPSRDGTPDPQGPGGTAFCFLVSGPDCEGVTTGGVALQSGGIGWRWARWALGWSVAYEALYARIRPMDRHAMAAGPRVSLQLLRALPDIAGVSPRSPTSAWGFELYAAAAQELSGTAAGMPITYGISLLGF